MSNHTYEIIVKNGRLLLPENGISAGNLAVKEGNIVESAPEPFPDEDAKLVLDAHSAFVVPGLIDFHTHILFGVAPLAVPANDYMLSHGVTTVIDAGSGGVDSLKDSLRVMADAQLRALAFMHISRLGIPQLDMHGDLLDISNAAVEETAQAIRENHDRYLGVKVRYGPRGVIGDHGIKVIELAKEAAVKSESNVMVHINHYPGTELKEILDLLEAGDIITHCFHDHETLRITDIDDNILDEVWDARERGIIFDVAHGRGSFSFKVTSDALRQGFEPDVISSDLHLHSIKGPAFDLLTTMGKFLNLRMEPEAILRKATEVPANLIGKPELGSLNKGTPADCTVLKIEEGSFHFYDCYGNEELWPKRFTCLATIQNGKIVYQK